MNSIEFINEVKNSKICPTDFDNIYKTFQKYQGLALETLYEVHRVCEKNNINYSLAYGSLLGMVRDGGQIPWDYDVDIMIKFKDKEKFIEALNKDLDDNFYYYSIENSNKCRHMIMRLAPKGYKTETLHVDVFFFIGTPDNERERVEFANKIKKLAQIRFFKKVNIFENTGFTIKKRIKYLIGKILYINKNINDVMKEYNKMCLEYDIDQSEIAIASDIFAATDQFENKYLWNTKIAKTNDNHELRIPVEYEKILQNKYGDYKKIFPLENRLNELMFHYKTLVSQNGGKE